MHQQNQKIEFKGKNLPNDELNLTIPMHDTDVVEVKNNPRLIPYLLDTCYHAYLFKNSLSISSKTIIIFSIICEQF